MIEWSVDWCMFENVEMQNMNWTKYYVLLIQQQRKHLKFNTCGVWCLCSFPRAGKWSRLWILTSKETTVTTFTTRQKKKTFSWRTNTAASMMAGVGQAAVLIRIILTRQLGIGGPITLLWINITVLADSGRIYCLFLSINNVDVAFSSLTLIHITRIHVGLVHMERHERALHI